MIFTWVYSRRRFQGSKPFVLWKCKIMSAPYSFPKDLSTDLRLSEVLRDSSRPNNCRARLQFKCSHHGHTLTLLQCVSDPLIPTWLKCPTLHLPHSCVRPSIFLTQPLLCQSTAGWPRLRAPCASSVRKSGLNICFGTRPSSLCCALSRVACIAFWLSMKKLWPMILEIPHEPQWTWFTVADMKKQRKGEFYRGEVYFLE